MTKLRYLEANIWELFLAMLIAISTLNYFISPPPGGITTPEWIWNLLYGIGALCITLGLLALSARIEVAGLSLFAGGAIVNALRLAQIAGTAAWLQILVLALFASAALIRGYTIARLLR